MPVNSPEYIGFWPRVGAAIIDTLLMGVIIWPILTAFYGQDYWMTERIVAGPLDFLLSWVFPAVAVVAFWIARQATPGKMLISAKIVDAETGKAPSTRQYIGRYLAYYVSTLPLCLGLIWVAFDKRKQGWHDKLAGTVVIRVRRNAADPDQ